MTSTAPLADGATSNLRPPLGDASTASTDNHAARSAKLGFGALTVYGSGSLVENITTFAVGSLLLFYLTIVCGLSGSEGGAALGATLVVDSIIDPVVGSLSDNSRSRHGRRHPFMLLSIIPIVITFGLLFSVPHGLRGLPLFGYALATLFSLRVAISFFYVPYMALGAELTDNYAERSTVVAGRVFFTVIGGLAAAILTWGVFLQGDGRLKAAAYSPLAWTFGGIVVAGGLLSTLGTLRARDRMHSAPDGRKFGIGQLLAEVVEVLRNPSFLSLFFPCLILFTALGVAGALTLHANTFFWKLGSGQILFLSIFALSGVFIGIFGAGVFARGMEKRSTAMLGLVLIGIAQLGPVLLRLSGVIPLSAAVPTLATATMLGGFGGSIATIAFQSMMADATDEHEFLFGARREGLYFAGVTLSAKAASGLGAWIGGVALDVIGFPHGLAGSPAQLAQIPAETIRNLGIAYGPGAAVFTAVSVAVLTTYKLNKAKYAGIQAELHSRRAVNAD
ncbi:MAG TPA: MFS transporter [Caulobacteraceae bacterium]|jgi:GPH family glycoside/pentoside/hexuronide:cation symporter